MTIDSIIVSHRNAKIRVLATAVFCFQKSTESNDYSTEVSDETNETFESVLTTLKLVKFINFLRNFVISIGIFQALTNEFCIIFAQISWPLGRLKVLVARPQIGQKRAETGKFLEFSGKNESLCMNFGLCEPSLLQKFKKNSSTLFIFEFACL
jgi:hypothetical protein